MSGLISHYPDPDQDAHGEDSSKFDLIHVHEELNLQDVIAKVEISKNLNRKNSDFLSDSPGLVGSGINSTKKEIDLSGMIQKKVFECPTAVKEEVGTQAANKLIWSNLQFERGGTQIRRNKPKANEVYEIFKRFYLKEKVKNSFSNRFLSNHITQLMYLYLLFFALFSDEFRTLVCYPSTDYLWDICTIICFLSFTLEIILSIFAFTGYIFSFYFWTDLLSTFSLLLDVSQINREFLLISQRMASGFDLIGRLTRLIRLVRLIRITKIYKSLVNSRNDISFGEEEIVRKTKQESKVGKKLSELATKRVIITCFILIIFLPFFTAELLISNQGPAETACTHLSILLNNNNFVSLFDQKIIFDDSNQDPEFSTLPGRPEKYLNYYTSRMLSSFVQNGGRILKIEFKHLEHNYYYDEIFNERRLEEMNFHQCRSNRNLTERSIIVYEDDWADNQMTAILNILRTFFVSAIVLGGSHLFGRDIQRLMISPIERMIEKVSEFMREPQKIKENALIEQEDKEVAAKHLGIDFDDENDGDEPEKKREELETVQIEAAINKIGILLGIGLGDAGTSLIGSYVGKEEEGDILIPGVEIQAVFGFCDIRNFTDMTEILQEEVMVFVNTVAEIVHTITDSYLGNANKNVGDAFLLVWKPPTSITNKMKVTKTNQENLMSSLTDLALIALMKIYAEVSRSFKLLKYVKNEKILERLKVGKIKLGFGLHTGWAIEGAIGSYHKLDVSYLSPNVNMAATLESSCKQYGVPILLSGQVFDKLSGALKKVCRKVDVVELKDSSEPLRLYTPDVSDASLKYPSHAPLESHPHLLKECRLFKENIVEAILHGTNVGPPLFLNDPDINLLCCFHNDEFTQFYNVAMESYLRGEWKMSQNYLEKCLEINPKDGPSSQIYQFIKKEGFSSPTNWKGYRQSKD